MIRTLFTFQKLSLLHSNGDLTQTQQSHSQFADGAFQRRLSNANVNSILLWSCRKTETYTNIHILYFLSDKEVPSLKACNTNVVTLNSKALTARTRRGSPGCRRDKSPFQKDSPSVPVTLSCNSKVTIIRRVAPNLSTSLGLNSTADEKHGNI